MNGGVKSEGDLAITPNESEERLYRLGDELNIFDEHNIDINPKLTKEQRYQLVELLRKFNDRFALTSRLIGRTNTCEHSIYTGDSPPVHQPLYRVSHAEREIIREQVSEIYFRWVWENTLCIDNMAQNFYFFVRKKAF